MVSYIKSAIEKKDFPDSEKEVVFVGRSNSGKSSLINCLYKKGIAYTGKMPGKTKLISFFDVDGLYTAVDVPGYGYANRSKKEAIVFAKMMDDYFERTDIIKLVIMIVDVRIGLSQDDLDMYDYLSEKKIPFLIVANKIDKLSNNQLYNKKRKVFADYDSILYVSALKRTNIDLLKEKILESIQ